VLLAALAGRPLLLIGCLPLLSGCCMASLSDASLLTLSSSSSLSAMDMRLPAVGLEAVPRAEMTSFSFLAGLRGCAFGFVVGVLAGALGARGAVLPFSSARFARFWGVGLKPGALQLLHPDRLHTSTHGSNADACMSEFTTSNISSKGLCIVDIQYLRISTAATTVRYVLHVADSRLHQVPRCSLRNNKDRSVRRAAPTAAASAAAAATLLCFRRAARPNLLTNCV
jgi:hypothetical protein